MKFLLFLVCVNLFHISADADLGSCSSGTVTIQQATEPVEHGEGPTWDPRHQLLYFVDISNQTVNRYNPKDGSVNSVFIGKTQSKTEFRLLLPEGGPVSPVILTRKDHWFVVGRGLDLILIHWDGVSHLPQHVKVIASVDKDKPRNRFNDGKADASGRLWVGTMGPEDPQLKLFQGSFNSFDIKENYKPKKHLSAVSVSNGLGWNFNDTLMYYIDSPTRNIDVFDFDLQRGSIKNRRTVLNLDKFGIPGVPDGMTMDSEDRLWVAVYTGGVILNIDPDSGTLLQTIRLPVSKPTSCAFGGPGLSTLYVTTSRRGFTEEQIREEPLAGSVLALRGLGAKGQRKTSTAATYAIPKLPLSRSFNAKSFQRQYLTQPL